MVLLFPVFKFCAKNGTTMEAFGFEFYKWNFMWDIVKQDLWSPTFIGPRLIQCQSAHEIKSPLKSFQPSIKLHIVLQNVSWDQCRKIEQMQIFECSQLLNWISNQIFWGQGPVKSKTSQMAETPLMHVFQATHSGREDVVKKL